MINFFLIENEKPCNHDNFFLESKLNWPSITQIKSKISLPHFEVQVVDYSMGGFKEVKVDRKRNQSGD